MFVAARWSLFAVPLLAAGDASGVTLGDQQANFAGARVMRHGRRVRQPAVPRYQQRRPVGVRRDRVR